MLGQIEMILICGLISVASCERREFYWNSCRVTLLNNILQSNGNRHIFCYNVLLLYIGIPISFQDPNCWSKIATGDENLVDKQIYVQLDQKFLFYRLKSI